MAVQRGQTSTRTLRRRLLNGLTLSVPSLCQTGGQRDHGRRQSTAPRVHTLPDMLWRYVVQGGPEGSWKPAVYCPEGTFASGYAMKVCCANSCCNPIKEWVSFFLGSWGMNRSAGQTNRVNREAVLEWFVCSALRFIPHEPRKKTLIPYIYNVSKKDSF